MRNLDDYLIVLKIDDFDDDKSMDLLAMLVVISWLIVVRSHSILKHFSYYTFTRSHLICFFQDKILFLLHISFIEKITLHLRYAQQVRGLHKKNNCIHENREYNQRNSSN